MGNFATSSENVVERFQFIFTKTYIISSENYNVLVQTIFEIAANLQRRFFKLDHFQKFSFPYLELHKFNQGIPFGNSGFSQGSFQIAYNFGSKLLPYPQ